MSKSFKHEILVVDDDEAVRDSIEMVLRAGGYDVSTAIHGFDGLLHLKRKLPSVLLSDLNMPQMSGFELLSVVRRRFPQISVIAMSGAYHSVDSVPGGVIADAFYSKGRRSPETLLNTVAELIRTSCGARGGPCQRNPRPSGYRETEKIRKASPTWCSPVRSACAHFP